MKPACLLPALSLFLLIAPSCISFRLTADQQPSVKMRGLGTAYAGVSGIDEWDGNLIRLGLFQGTARAGEFFSLDIWPFGGVGVGVVGARVRVLPFEVGAGALLYHPRLPHRPEKEKPVEVEIPEGDTGPGGELTGEKVVEEVVTEEAEMKEEEMEEEEIEEEEIQEEEVVEEELKKKKKKKSKRRGGKVND